MRKATKLICVLALVLGGCSGGGDAVVAPPQGNQVDFFQFVQNQVAATADDTDPVEINDLDFLGADVEDESAFQNLLN